MLASFSVMWIVDLLAVAQRCERRQAKINADSLAEIGVRRTPNKADTSGPYPHHDVDRLWNFIVESLASLGKEHAIEAISVTTHGVTVVLLDRGGGLALPVLDYEHDGPDATRAEYTLVRPDFAETGSPALPIGLNVGPQLFWQQRSFPDDFARTATILMYPQYWTWRLSGVLANEVTSLGCHTDLWNPHAGDYSTLVDRMGWRPLFAPIRPADAVLGPLLPDIARRTGLPATTPVLCGIHDSNASLLPHLRSRAAPFAVVSTGTWVISMAIGGKKAPLDPARDTLINVSAFGEPVPSARFMGGREFEILFGSEPTQSSDADIGFVLDRGIMLLPSVQHGSGPFPSREARWIGPADLSPGQRTAAASFYLAMMTATCLELIGAEGPVIVEGPFARNRPFAQMLAAATGRPVLPQEGQAGTSVGAALLHAGAAVAKAADPHAVSGGAGMARYAYEWRREVART